MFVHHREPRPAWTEALALIAPRSDRVNWLLCLWEPGDPWEPVQRWEIREMIPRLEYVDPIHLAAYRGPHPRTLGHWVGTGAAKRWETDADVSRTQYELFHRYQCHSRRVWVVQGPNGGHPFEYTRAEQAFLRALGRDPETPAPGTLPYAEPDARTWARLGALDKLRHWEHALTWDQRQEVKTQAGLWVQRDRRADYAAFGQAMLTWYDEGIKEAVDNVPRKDLQFLRDNTPRDEEPRNTEDLDAQFLSSSTIG